MKKLVIIPLLFIAFTLAAAPIKESRAREIATQFFTQSATRSSSVSLELEWAGNTFGKTLSASNGQENLLYIYNRNDTKGFVIVAGDDTVQPIIAYSHSNTFDIENMADGARWVLEGWCRQIAATSASASLVGAKTLSEESYTKVCGNTTALWNQGEPYNSLAPIMNGSRCLTGCVATAMSIIAYHNKWPEKGVGTIPSYNMSWASLPENPLGHTYNYSMMLSDYNGGYSTLQGDAVARLMYDMGTAVKMEYGLGASSAYSNAAYQALITYFGYSKSALFRMADGVTTERWCQELRENIKECGPTYFSGVSESGGHAFVLEDYASSGHFFINYGWGGVSNGAYLLPDIEYTYGQDAIFGLIPDKTGTSTYQDYLGLVGLYNNGELLYRGLQSLSMTYATDATISCRVGAIQNIGAAEFNGELYLVHCDKQGEVKTELMKLSFSGLLPYYYFYYSSPLRARIVEEIEEGDRIRLYYEGEYSKSYQWARAAQLGIADEILLTANAEQIAESLSFGYSKSEQVISFQSKLPLHYSLINSSGDELISGDALSYKKIALYTGNLPAGEYKLLFSMGEGLYELMIKK